MSPAKDILDEAGRISAVFQGAGGAYVEADVLQPAATLLDLYGEDIRARAYVTQDPVVGEMMLRPDFTVPVVQMHMTIGAEPARYVYAGKVFRKQDEEDGRPREYIQVGYELFDRVSPVDADAEVFALVLDAVSGMDVRAVTGDIGILTAAVCGLRTTEKRKAALMRHIWRPKRFRALLDRFGGRSEMPASRRALLDGSGKAPKGQMHVGLRSPQEVEERIEALRQDAAEPSISASEMDLLDDLLGIRADAPAALEQLRDLAVDLPQISGAVERMDDRLKAIGARGVDPAQINFEAAYGRTSLEYYDGFVFGIYAEGRPDLPPIATGGRYDALTERLGGGRSIPAVGAVVRPGLTLAAREGQA